MGTHSSLSQTPPFSVAFHPCLFLCLCDLPAFCRHVAPVGICVLCLVAQLCPTLCNPMDCSTPGSSVHADSPGKNTGVGCHALLQEIFPTHGSSPGLLYCRQILYCLSHQGGPRILGWVDYPFSRGTYQPRNHTRASCIAGRFFTN